jgi:hypothetical protein
MGELVALNPDVIVAGATSGALAAYTARNLTAANKIATCAWMFGAQRHAVYRFGYPPPERHQIISLKSCTITPRGNSATHKRRPVTIDGEFEVTLHKPPSDL